MSTDDDMNIIELGYHPCFFMLYMSCILLMFYSFGIIHIIFGSMQFTP